MKYTYPSFIADFKRLEFNIGSVFNANEVSAKFSNTKALIINTHTVFLHVRKCIMARQQEVCVWGGVWLCESGYIYGTAASRTNCAKKVTYWCVKTDAVLMQRSLPSSSLNVPHLVCSCFQTLLTLKATKTANQDIFWKYIVHWI